MILLYKSKSMKINKKANLNFKLLKILIHFRVTF